MKGNNRERDVIRRYLLGRVAEAELADLEERILSEDNFYQELLIAEDELIDQYLGDTLSESERSSFVSHFLITPERREKVRFSKTLRRYVASETEGAAALDGSPEVVEAGGDSPRKISFGSFSPVTGHPSFLSSLYAFIGNPLRLSLTTATLLILVGFSIILINRSFNQDTPQPQDFYIATLSSGVIRDGGETTRITIPPDKKIVRFELQLESLPGSYQSYTAELKTSDNNTLLSRDHLLSEVKDAHKVVNLDVSAQVLKRGDYHVRLSGVRESGSTEPIGRYPFRILN